jgi:aminoglycoside phosphotransferase (APT) family kinase protein
LDTAAIFGYSRGAGNSEPLRQMASAQTSRGEGTPGADRPDGAILEFVAQSGLVTRGEPVLRRLTGGVSSDIWLVESKGRAFCVKRALSKLQVAADWFAPVERNANEWAWFDVVAGFLPNAVPKVLARGDGVFAMEYLPDAQYPNWKAQLRDGIVDVSVAAEVGRRLARIHGKASRMAELPARFSSNAIFHAIRLEPYLLATAETHPELGSSLRHLEQVTAGTKRTLVHGDVSPKNILIGPRGPVFLDAECAWWGDPAFDLAFCLNHMLLKCLWVTRCCDDYLASFRALAAAYRAGVDWEHAAEFERRAAALLPGLFLARVDGKSPVEYVTDERDKNRVRHAATALLREPVETLNAVADAWRDELNKDTE